MPIRVAIDGFGGLSRHFLLAVQAGGFSDLFEIAQINAPEGTAAVANRIKFDSIYGRFHGSVTHEGNRLTVNDLPITVTTEHDREKLDWAKADIDLVVIDSSISNGGAQAQLLLAQGAKKVVVAGRGSETELTLIPGVNDTSYDPDDHHAVATGTAAANAITPLCMVLNNTFAAVRVVYTVVNPVQESASAADSIGAGRLSTRASWRNIVPGSNALTAEVVSLAPSMDSKLEGLGVTVPVAPVGWLTLSMETERRLTRDDAISCITKAAASDSFVGVLGYTEDAQVSSDFTGDARSLVADLESVAMLGRSLVSVRGWFDAEWAIACRTADLVALVCEAGIPGTA